MKSKGSFSYRSHGRIQVLVSGVLVLIASMWLSADRLIAGEPELESSQSADKNLSEAARNALSEIRVTAQRVPLEEPLFVKPKVDIAVGEPDQPAQFWGEPGES